MKKLKLRVPAKINLTLDVLGVNGNYHDIKSLVASVDVYDEIILKARSDGKITLVNEGLPVGGKVTENNAYAAAKLFVEKYSVNGVDIKIKKRIPVGGGMGGSSADIAGVLKGLKALYYPEAELEPLANELGSDAAYMLVGGYAVISGRGEKVIRKDIKEVLYLLIIYEGQPVTARASYKKFDELGKFSKPCTDLAEKSLFEGNFEKLAEVVKNDLYSASCELAEGLKGNVFALKKAGAPCAIMSGSGSVVYGVFKDKSSRDAAYKKLKLLYGDKLIKAQTLVGF